MPPAPTTERDLRFFTGGVELRDNGQGKMPTIVGYAAKFNVKSDPIGPKGNAFREIIRPTFFDKVLASDVRGLTNHDSGQLLGRTTAGTMRLTKDNVGLRYEIDVPDTQAGRDTVTSLRRGDITGSSFSFRASVDKWGADDENPNMDLRELFECEKLWDVGPATFPAYPQAEAGLRSLEAFRQEQRKIRESSEQASRDIEFRLARAKAC